MPPKRVNRRPDFYGTAGRSVKGKRGGSFTVGQINNDIQIGFAKAEIVGFQRPAHPFDDLYGICSSGGASVLEQFLQAIRCVGNLVKILGHVLLSFGVY